MIKTVHYYLIKTVYFYLVIYMEYLGIRDAHPEYENLDSDIRAKLENIIKKDTYVKKGSHSIEEVMFGKPTFLEENSFSTGHQFVNVYGVPEMKYEIRREDAAVDIQVHEEKH